MNSNKYAFEASADNFQKSVIEASHKLPILIDFWANWCNPCKILLPILEKITLDYGGKIQLAKVDSEKERELTAQFGVRSIPSVFLLKNGVVVDTFSGVIPEDEICAVIDAHLPCESDDLLEEAQQAYQRGDKQQGLALCEKATNLAPDKLRIVITTAKLQLDNEQYLQAGEHLRRLPMDIQLDPVVSPLFARLSFVKIIE